MSNPVSIVNVEDIAWKEDSHGEHYVSAARRLSGKMALGVRVERIPPGKLSCPYHYHLKEDEFFLVLSGKAMLRHGEETVEVREGDAISCPHGEDGAHQLYNHTDESFEMLSVGRNQGSEVCFYPDSGKWMIGDLKQVGTFTETDYWHGEPDPPLMKR